MRVAGILILALHLPYLPLHGQDDPLNPEADSWTYNLSSLREHYKEGVRQRLYRAAHSPWADTRTWAAMLLGELEPESELLERLLKDPDSLVRRVAAESKFGVDVALSAEIVKRYPFEDVVEAEQKTKVLLAKFKEVKRSERTVWLNELMAQGRQAQLPMRARLALAETEERWCLFYVLQELEARHDGEWSLEAQELYKKLKRPITFHFDNATAYEAFAIFTAKAGVSITFSSSLQKDWSADRNGKSLERNSLRINDLEARIALEWIMRLYGVDFSVQKDSLCMARRVNWDGVQTTLIDVGDLLNADFKPEWGLFLNGIEEYHTLVLAPFGERYGFLSISCPVNGEDHQGRGTVHRIVEALNKERIKRKLPAQVLEAVDNDGHWPKLEAKK